MSADRLARRLDRDPALVECAMCRHRQPVDATPSRCEQCGSDIVVYGEREAARGALDALVDQGRAAYFREISRRNDPEGNLYAVITNRAFRRRD